MPPKRRDTSVSSTPISKRQKVEIDKTKLQQFFQTTVQSVINLRDEDDRPISRDFLKLPSNKLYPDYYQLIQQPISIHEIKSKVSTKKYEDVSEFVEDFRTMAKNANFYNDTESEIAVDSNKILEFVEEQAAELESEATIKDDPDATPNYTANMEKLLKHVIDLKVPRRGRISDPFMDEVDGELYPDYYKFITKAMAFNTVLDNLDKGVYADGVAGVDAFEADVTLMFQNAFTYNEEESLIFKDATTLKEVFTKKMEELRAELPSEQSGIKIKLKPGRKPSSQPATPKVVLNLKKIKDDIDPVVAEETPIKKKRGRKPKRVIIEEEDMQVDDPEPSEEEQIPLKDQFTYSHTRAQKPAPSFIQDLAVSTSKTLVTPNPYYNAQHSQPENTIPQFFEFYFPSIGDDSLSGTRNYSITVPNMGGTVTILTTLHESLLKRKYSSTMVVNGERVTPSPLTTYSDDDLLKTKFEVKLGTGLNSIQYTCSVAPVIELDANGKLPPRSATNPTNKDNSINESVLIWINVAQ